MNEIELSLRNILSEFESIKEAKADVMSINEEQDLQTIGLNSLDFIHLIAKIEGKYGIFVENEDLVFEKFNTLYKMRTYVETNI